MDKQLEEYLRARGIDPTTVQNNPALLNQYTQELITLNQTELDEGVGTRQQRRFNKRNSDVNFTTSSRTDIEGQSINNNNIFGNTGFEPTFNENEGVLPGNEINIDPSTSIFNDFGAFNPVAPENPNKDITTSNTPIVDITGNTKDNTDPSLQNSENTRQNIIGEDSRRGFESDLAFAGNVLGAGVSLDTALFSLGQSLAFDKNAVDNNGVPLYQNPNKAATGNILRGVGAAGKALFGGTRQLLAGKGFQNRNNQVNQNFYERRRRNLIGRSTEASQSNTNFGGFEDGGSIGNNTDYKIGQTIKFEDEEGNIVEGTIKKIKNGEIFL